KENTMGHGANARDKSLLIRRIPCSGASRKRRGTVLARCSLHTRFVSTLGLLLVWSGLLGTAGVSHGQLCIGVIHAFTDAGRFSLGRVIRDNTGTLYGTTENGCTFGRGTVYRVDASGQFTILHSFKGSDGATPQAGVISDSAGTLYGTTQSG